MIPSTPLLLAASALAMARAGARLVRRHPEIPCSLEFVQSLGRVTHFDLRLGRSSFPIEGVASFQALAALAVARGWRRDGVEAGDLLLTCAGGAMGDDTAVHELSIVLEVAEYGRAPGRVVRRCTLATARGASPAPREAMRVVERVQWCDTGGGDLAIRWSAMPDEWESAA